MTGYLLDTHTALWWWTDAPKLSARAYDVVKSSSEPMNVSAASAFEIALKWRLGKLSNIGDPRDSYRPLMARNAFAELVITNEHAILAGTLDGRHGDPFDRMIAAQALIHDLTILTCDAQLATLGCKVFW